VSKFVYDPQLHSAKAVAIHFQLAADTTEATLESLEGGVPHGDDPFEARQHADLRADVLRRLEESYAELALPADLNDVRNFVAVLQRTCARSLTKDDAPFLAALAEMVARLNPTRGALEIARTVLFAESDGDAPTPVEVKWSLEAAEIRVSSIGRRIESLREREAGNE
jgi:hypothetical protein